MSDVEVVWKARDAGAAEMVQRCADGLLPFHELCGEFRRRGWSTQYVYEAVRNAEVNS